ncbi:MAG: L-rhamnonate dehydratase [Thermomicrobiales bacterium]|nr:L-rhamnonate dehydratase [Thermomicrobiales bacterium]
MIGKDDRIAEVRAYIPVEGIGGYFEHTEGHWLLDTIIANPMSGYPDYYERRSSWGAKALGTVLVEIETDGGLIGQGVSQGGVPSARIVVDHLSRFLLGSDPRDVERIWDQMFRSTLPYGRKGLALCAISAVDIALWDLCGKLRGEPVYKLLGGETKQEIPCYLTGPQPWAAKELGFFGGKMPLPHGPADGTEGLNANVEMVAKAREAVGPDFELMLDCYMALDVPYTIDLANAVRPYRVRWIEEALPPDDYDGHARIKAACPWQRFSTGEHEYTRYGFRELITRGNLDLLQPDLAWVGGITEAKKIAAMAQAYDLPVVPHGSGVFSTHFQMASSNGPFQEVLAMSPTGDDILPIWNGLIDGDPLPKNGVVRPPDRPGWGIELVQDRMNLVDSAAA